MPMQGYSVEDFMLFGSDHATRRSVVNVSSGVAEQPHNSDFPPAVAQSGTERLLEKTHTLQEGNSSYD